MKTHIIIQARLGSTRLPGKVLLKLAGKSVLWHVLDRCRRAKRVDEIIVATTDLHEDDQLVQHAQQLGIRVCRGDSDDVLSRYAKAIRMFGTEVVVRITSDCPLVDPWVIDNILTQKKTYDYVSNVLDRTFPRGLDVEVVTADALLRADREATEQFDREHVTPFIRSGTDHGFRTRSFKMPKRYHAQGLRFTLDTKEDLAFLRSVYRQWYQPENIIDVPTLISWLQAHPEISGLNSDVTQKPDPPR